MRLCTLLLTAMLQAAPGTSSAAGDLLFPTAQTTYSWPLRLGGRIGLNRLEPEGSSRFSFSVTGVFVEAGRDGMRLGLGCGRRWMNFLPVFGGGLAVSGMYVWEGDDSVFLGLESSVSVTLVSLYGGICRRISGDALDDLVVSAGIGSGLP